MPDAQPLSEPRRRGGAALRVLAHPLRSRLLAELRVNGPATATDLATALRTNTGATSYHLRKLEEVGLVVDSRTGSGRRRVWAAHPEGLPPVIAGAVDEADLADEDDDDALAAATWLARDYVQHFGEKAQAWLDQQGDWPPAWREVCGLQDHLVLVSAEQLTALHAELLEVAERYRRVGQGNPAAKRVLVYTCAVPVDPIRH